MLDIRLPIGVLFTLMGLLLVAYGLVSDPAIYHRSLGINVNLWWGIVLLAFGLLMWALARSRSTRGPETPPTTPDNPPVKPAEH